MRAFESASLTSVFVAASLDVIRIRRPFPAATATAAYGVPFTTKTPLVGGGPRGSVDSELAVGVELSRPRSTGRRI